MLKIAVITGGHHFEVVPFHHLFRELPGVDAYVQHMADFVASTPEARAQYDVLVFYTHLKRELSDLGVPPGQPDSVRAVLETLGAANQGLVLLHHSLLAFPEWAIWDEIVGMTGRKLDEYAHDQALPLHVADPHHAICAGLDDWTITDETYLMPDVSGADNHVLLTTPHPRSMTTIAWTRQFRTSRVFCLQLGHDSLAWNDAGFRRLLAQGIAWCGKQ